MAFLRVANLPPMDVTNISQISDKLGLVEQTLAAAHPMAAVEVVKPKDRSPHEEQGVSYNYVTNSQIIRITTPDKLYMGRADNQLLNAVLYAYNSHGGLRLSPDVILQCVAMAVANCVNAHHDEYRDIFVNHEGMKTLTAKGEGGFNWEELVNLMSSEIDNNTKVWDFLKPTFTTTTQVIATVATLTKMATFKKYFNYHMEYMCGINNVMLTGTIDDWFLLKSKVENMRDIICAKRHMVNWFKHVLTVIDYLIETYEAAKARRNADDYQKLGDFAAPILSVKLKVFWSRIITYVPHGSGGQQYISGWLKVLIPGDNYDDFPKTLSILDAYSSMPEQTNDFWSGNYYDWQNRLKSWAGLTFEEPKGCTFVEVKLNQDGNKQDLYVLSGFVGFRVDGNNYVTPEIGYIVHSVPEGQGTFITQRALKESKKQAKPVKPPNVKFITDDGPPIVPEQESKSSVSEQESNSTSKVLNPEQEPNSTSKDSVSEREARFKEREKRYQIELKNEAIRNYTPEFRECSTIIDHQLLITDIPLDVAELKRVVRAEVKTGIKEIIAENRELFGSLNMKNEALDRKCVIC
jgi:hypothetical protein